MFDVTARNDGPTGRDQPTPTAPHHRQPTPGRPARRGPRRRPRCSHGRHDAAEPQDDRNGATAWPGEGEEEDSCDRFLFQ